MKYFQHECGKDGTIRDDSGRLFCLSCGLALDELPDDGSMARMLALVRLILLETGSKSASTDTTVPEFVQKIEKQTMRKVVTQIMQKLKTECQTKNRT